MFQKIGIAVLVLSGIALVDIAEAHIFPRLFCGCGTCEPCRTTARMRRAQRACKRCARLSCTCAAPAPAPCVVPTVETTMVPRTVMTYRNVPQTVNCRVPYMETVPVTTFRNVMVDEGGYQQVWVPKMVTRQVPQTSYQQQTRYRDVSYQVNRRVAERQIQYVPRRRVIYRPLAPQVFTPPPAASCPTCNDSFLQPTIVPQTPTSTVPSTTPDNAPVPDSTTYMPPNLPIQSTYVPPTTSGLPMLSNPVPVVPTSPTNVVPSPTPDPAMVTPATEDRTSWKTIRQRTTSALERADDHRISSGYRTINQQQYDSGVTSTAANVWQTQLR